MEQKKHYRGAYLTNWQYGGYSYIEEDPGKPEELWAHGMVDYADPESVIGIAEREGLPTISLAGGFWERIGYKGWGEKVSISEARTALAKAREHILGRSTSSEQHSNPGDQPLVGEVERVMARYNVSREEAERWLKIYPGEKLLSEGGGGSGKGTAAGIIDKEFETKIERLRTELETLRDEAHDRLRGMRLSDWVTCPDSPGIVIHEERAKATPCKCFAYKGKDYCYSAGIIGMLEAEQVPTYCPTREYEVRPGIKERFEEFADAAEAAHKRIEHIPKGERLIPWVTEMGKELRARGVEV